MSTAELMVCCWKRMPGVTLVKGFAEHERNRRSDWVTSFRNLVKLLVSATLQCATPPEQRKALVPIRAPQ